MSHRAALSRAVGKMIAAFTAPNVRARSTKSRANRNGGLVTTPKASAGADAIKKSDAARSHGRQCQMLKSASPLPVRPAELCLILRRGPKSIRRTVRKRTGVRSTMQARRKSHGRLERRCATGAGACSSGEVNPLHHFDLFGGRGPVQWVLTHFDLTPAPIAAPPVPALRTPRPTQGPKRSARPASLRS